MRFTECATVEGYTGLAAEIGGAIPYLSCAEHWRREARRRVLGEHYAGIPEASPPSLLRTGLVVAVGQEFSTVAESLSRRLGFVLLAVCPQKLPAWPRDVFMRAATYVGSPQDLNAEVVRYIASMSRENWCLITGRDLAAASFVGAK